MLYIVPRRAIHLLIHIASLAILAVAGITPLFPPAPPKTAAPVQFQIANALAHVHEIARQPHPNGSPENERVRRYLVEQLQGLGLTPHVQSASVYRPRWKKSFTVHNIFARLPGTVSNAGSARNQPAGTILLCAHYDSVPFGPGAADDAANVAAILETLRAIRSSSPLRRDLLILFTDGEELGELGARAFIDDSLASRIQWDPPLPQWKSLLESDSSTRPLVLNFEARGTSGPSIMFETAPHNLALIRQYAAAVHRPVASSLSYDVYRLMPNDTDFTIFRHAGLKGLNFAFIGDPQNYHTARDDLAHLDPRSLFHQGRAALSLCRTLGNLDDTAFANLSSPNQPSAIYFNLPGMLVIYPANWVWPIAIVQLAAVALLIATSIRRKLIRLGRIIEALVVILVSLIVGPLLVYWAAQWIAPTISASPWEILTSLAIALPILVCLALFAALGRARVLELSIVILAILALLSLASARFAPGASYLLAWPGIFAAIGAFRAIKRSRKPLRTTTPATDNPPGSSIQINKNPPPLFPLPSWSDTLLSIVAAAPTLLLIPPTVALAGLALGRLLLPLVALVPALFTWVVLAAGAVHLTPRPKS